MNIDEIIKNCIEHSEYDIPEMTQIILKQSAIALAKLKEYVPQDCTTCNHENCEDCDSSFKFPSYAPCMIRKNEILKEFNNG